MKIDFARAGVILGIYSNGYAAPARAEGHPRRRDFGAAFDENAIIKFSTIQAGIEKNWVWTKGDYVNSVLTQQTKTISSIYLKLFFHENSVQVRYCILFSVFPKTTSHLLETGTHKYFFRDNEDNPQVMALEIEETSSLVKDSEKYEALNQPGLSVIELSSILDYWKRIFTQSASPYPLPSPLGRMEPRRDLLNQASKIEDFHIECRRNSTSTFHLPCRCLRSVESRFEVSHLYNILDADKPEEILTLSGTSVLQIMGLPGCGVLAITSMETTEEVGCHPGKSTMRDRWLEQDVMRAVLESPDTPTSCASIINKPPLFTQESWSWSDILFTSFF